MAKRTGVVPVMDCLPFAVDTWTSETLTKPQFLSHAHKDHLVGIQQYGKQIYCTELSRQLVCLKYPHLSSTATFELIEPGSSHLVTYRSQTFTVTCFDANHCAGAVMLLFQGAFGTILHTGDSRMDEGVVNRVRAALAGTPIDLMYLDSTFGTCKQEFPTLRGAVQQVVDLIRQHLHVPRVYLSCEGLGSEPLAKAVASAFNCRLFLPDLSEHCCFATRALQEERARELQLLVPKVLTKDKNSTKFVIVGGRLLPQFALRVKEENPGGPPPLFIRPSAQKIALHSQEYSPRELLAKHRVALTAPFFDSNGGVYYVLYSCHSSRQEILDAVARLQPRAIVAHSGQIDPSLLCSTQPVYQVEAEIRGVLERRLANPALDLVLALPEGAREKSASQEKGAPLPADLPCPPLIQTEGSPHSSPLTSSRCSKKRKYDIQETLNRPTHGCSEIVLLESTTTAPRAPSTSLMAALLSDPVLSRMSEDRQACPMRQMRPSGSLLNHQSTICLSKHQQNEPTSATPISVCELPSFTTAACALGAGSRDKEGSLEQCGAAGIQGPPDGIGVHSAPTEPCRGPFLNEDDFCSPGKITRRGPRGSGILSLPAPPSSTEVLLEHPGEPTLLHSIRGPLDLFQGPELKESTSLVTRSDELQDQYQQLMGLRW